MEIIEIWIWISIATTVTVNHLTQFLVLMAAMLILVIYFYIYIFTSCILFSQYEYPKWFYYVAKEIFSLEPRIRRSQNFIVWSLSWFAAITWKALRVRNMKDSKESNLCIWVCLEFSGLLCSRLVPKYFHFYSKEGEGTLFNNRKKISYRMSCPNPHILCLWR